MINKAKRIQKLKKWIIKSVLNIILTIDAISHWKSYGFTWPDLYNPISSNSGGLILGFDKFDQLLR
jgi:hypothetical protein